MILEKPRIFRQFENLIFGFSTKTKLDKNDNFSFNLSKSIGDDDEKVNDNRKYFFSNLNFKMDEVVVQKQIHSDIINVVNKFIIGLKGDALITKTRNLGLAVSTADCNNIYLYDSQTKVIAAVHSGWEGTEKRILEKTIIKLKNEFDSNPNDLFVYMGPAISQMNYEVGEEFLTKFEAKYLVAFGEKYLLDLKTANKDILIDSGVPEKQIEVSDICSFAHTNYHSYRRDKQNSGRAFGVIALK